MTKDSNLVLSILKMTKDSNLAPSSQTMTKDYNRALSSLITIINRAATSRAQWSPKQASKGDLKCQAKPTIFNLMNLARITINIKISISQGADNKSSLGRPKDQVSTTEEGQTTLIIIISKLIQTFTVGNLGQESRWPGVVTWTLSRRMK
jgi:hypothetical protein